MCKVRILALLFAATLFAAAMGMPHQDHTRAVRQVSTYAADGGSFFKDFFQIPIQALQAVSNLLSNSAMRIQRRREAYEAAHRQQQNDRGELRRA